MSNIAIAYIGPKPVKRDTITGSRQVFPRFQPINVTPNVAAILLRYDKVFVEADRLDEAKAAEKAQKAAEEQAAKEAQELAQKQAAESDLTVVVEGEAFDLAKMNSPKIAALVEGAGLDFAPKGAQEAVGDYKKRVRDAFISVTLASKED